MSEFIYELVSFSLTVSHCILSLWNREGKGKRKRERGREGKGERKRGKKRHPPSILFDLDLS